MKYVLYLGFLYIKCFLVCSEWSTNLEVFEEVVNDEFIEIYMGCWFKTYAYNIDKLKNKRVENNWYENNKVN